MTETPTRGVRAVWRAGLLLSLALLMIGATMVAAGSPAARGAQPNPLDPESGVLLGMYPKPKDGDWTQTGFKRRWNQVEEYAGRTLDVGHYYYKMHQQFPTYREQWHVDRGRIPMVSWSDVKTTKVTNGDYDAQIIARANDVKAFGEPILIRWFWEMDGNKNASNAGTPSQYIAAWKHIVQIFRNRNVDNAQFVWCPNADAFKRGNAQQWYPGDAWVDWLCADGYNWAPGKPGTRWRSLGEIFEDFHDWGAPKGKPMMIGETGVQERNPGEKAAWYRDVVRDLKRDLPEIDMLNFYDSDTIYGWWVDTSASSVAGFHDMATDPYLNGGATFSDTFDDGIRRWDHAVDARVDRSGAPTESGAPVLKLEGDSAGGAYVRTNVRPGLDAMCITTSFKISALDRNVTLIRFQNDPGYIIGRVFIHGNTGVMWVKSDVTGKAKRVHHDFDMYDWHNVTVCAERGREGSWEVRVDDTTVFQWDTRNSNKRIRSFRLGEGGAKDFIVRFDDVLAWVPD